MSEEQNRFSLRKLSVGLASVLIGVSIFGTSQTVKADTVANNQTSSVTNNAQSSDTQENKNAAKSSFSNDNQANNVKSNLIQTQDKGKNDQKQDSAPKTQEATDGSNLDAEKDIVRTSSLQESDNQSNDHAEDNSQSQNEQKLDLTKNSKKFAKKVLATNLIATSTMTNGGFDEATWGKLDVNNWKGNVQGDYYQLTDYTGDVNHIIVPNEADFAKAGISTSGKQVGVTSDLMHTIFRDKTTAQDATIAFSKTDNKQVKAIGTDWDNTWGHANDYVNGSWISAKGELTKFDGNNLDVANVTNMSYTFFANQISDLSSLANWNVNNVTNMSNMFAFNSISDLSPLANWNVKVANVTNMSSMFKYNQISGLSPLAKWNISNVTNMSSMFEDNQISDLSPLANWNVKVANVTNMSSMFEYNQISDLSPLANWNVNNVTDMSYMFFHNQINDLSPLTNWNVNNVTNMSDMFAFNSISDLSPLANWNVKVANVTNMSSMFEYNQISDLSPLANWNVKVANVTNMSSMFEYNQINDLSPLANWNVNNVTNMSAMFNSNLSTQTKNIPAKRVISFVYPDGYTGKKQDLVTQTVDVPQEVQVELITKDSKPSNNILDWVTKKETPEASDLVYFLDYTVPTVANLVSSISTVAKQEADPNNPINVTVTYTASPVTVHFVDVDENADKDSDAVKQKLGKTIQLSGTYGSNVDLSTVKLPANFVLDDTSSNTFGNTTDAYINLKHQHAKSTTQAPATRTIVVHMPDGTTKTYVQTIGFVNNLDKDLVTNKTTNIYTVDASKSNVTVNDQVSTQYQAYVLKDGVVNYAPIKLPHINGYKAHLVRNKINPAMFMVSFMAVPTENKPSIPVEVAPSKPSANPDNTNKPADALQQRVITELNSNDSGWTMPETSSTYTVEVPAEDAIIDLSDLVIAEPVHAMSDTIQIPVTKRFKLSKKHSIKHLKHRKKAVRTFKKYRL